MSKTEGTEETPATRVQPRGGATRWPFCHDEVTPEGEVVACRECLSRHHASCWEEGGACASCSAAECLTGPIEGEGQTEQQTQRTWLGMTMGELGLWALLIATSAFILGLVQSVAAFEKMFAETGLDLPPLTQLVLIPARHPMLMAMAVVAWVATAAMARKHRKGFITIVLVGVLVSVLILVIALFLPLIGLIEKL